MNIDGKIVVVTGAGSGLGAATAAHLADLGARLWLIDRDRRALEASEVEADQLLCLDVADAAAVEDSLYKAADISGPPAALVNCAGIAPAKRIVGRDGAMPLDDFEQVIRVNLVGTFNCMRVGAALMAKHTANEDGERGVIVNTSSVAAFEGQIGQAAYAASKGGIASLTLPAAREFASSGIRVVAIAPGLFATPLLLNMPRDVQDSLAATVPFPKRFGYPIEFAGLVAHIIENAMINGEVIRLDGALRMAPR